MDFAQAQSIAERHAPSPYYVDQYRGMERMYLPHLFAAVDERPPSRVLEVGPGWGTTAVWLADRGHDVTVIDLMPLGTWITPELIDEYPFTYVHHDIEDAPQPNGADLGTFDLVIMTQVIPHLAWRPDRAMAHVASLLKPEGEAIFSVLDRKDYRDLDATFGDDWRNVPEWGTTDKCEDIVKAMYTKSSFRSLLETQFKVTKLWKPMRSTVYFAQCVRR